jgi:hypothetical protein
MGQFSSTCPQVLQKTNPSCLIKMTLRLMMADVGEWRLIETNSRQTP